MSGIQLLPFQTRCSEQIVRRYTRLTGDASRPVETRRWDTPFYQALSAITGAGKTAILADAVAGLRASMRMEPVVLWISKARAVVDQTRADFEGGGKYAHLLEGFVVLPLASIAPDVINDGSTPVIALTTVGAFNQKDRELGTLRVHQEDEDRIGGSLWQALRDRQVGKLRRPLMVVYDEGHNLSDQQTDLLLELEPDVILVASATMKTPGRLGRIIDRLREYGWSDNDLVTAVNSRDVVEAGLVKRQIIIGGYVTIMESAIDDLLASMEGISAKADALNAGFRPKAIYVCKTNISQDDGTRDNHNRPFDQRKAPPILIWRHLVERRGVDPASIAVYCDLKFDRDHPPPDAFVHFSGGEDDFVVFRSGGYRHVIFNQSLQEGWDDSECCFAYIDKSMGSAVQVEQVIGRVLRQPGARHLPDPDLNSAHFFIRIDDKQEFPRVLETVRRRIGVEIPEVKIDGYSERRDRTRIRLEPKSVLTIPEIHIDSEEAIKYDDRGQPVGPLADAIRALHDYRADGVNTVGRGEFSRAIQRVADAEVGAVETSETQHSNRVLARWVLRRAIQSLYPRVAPAIDWSDPKFDARVEITSPAAAVLREAAVRIVDSYLEYSALAVEDTNPYSVGPIICNPSKLQRFKNSVHEGYGDLNALELEFAKAIDETGHVWARNPSNGGYGIPLLQKGEAMNFFPDFLVWKGGAVFALDPKGDHLIRHDAGVKLLTIHDEARKARVVVRLFTKGKWTSHEKVAETDDGYTVWSLGAAGKPQPRHYATPRKAVEAALRP